MKEPAPWVLVCEDDDDDFLLLSRAFEESGHAVTLVRAVDGEGLLPALQNPPPGTDPDYPYPRFVILDLRMPRKDGREALREVKHHAEYKAIPVIVLTTSKYHGDILRAYQDGANTFFTKPHDFRSLVAVISGICVYWLNAARVPVPAEGSGEQVLKKDRT